MGRDFEAIVRQVRDSGEQKNLEKRDVNARLKALGVALLFGVLVLAATTSALSGLSWWITTLWGLAALAALGAWDRATLRSILAAKEQDRRYFLSCLRQAQSIDELNRAGLFAYLPDSGGPAWVTQVKVDVANLRKALGEEPEWFEAA